MSVSVIADVVVRNVYYKYLHPKEALVSDGVLNRFVSRCLFWFVCFFVHVIIGDFSHWGPRILKLHLRVLC